MSSAHNAIATKLSLVLLLLLCGSGPTSAPTERDDATSPVTHPVTHQGRITAEQALTIEVTPESWRDVREELDDVYTNPDVSKLRNSAVQGYARAMGEVDQLATWKERLTARAAARRPLMEALEKMYALQDQLRTQGDRAASNEAALAALEMHNQLGDFTTVVKSADNDLQRELPPAQQAQVYRLLIRAAPHAQEAEKAIDARKRFQETIPDEARFDVVTNLPFGPLRAAVDLFSDAQNADDFALRHDDKPEISDPARATRDKQRELAAMSLELRQR